MVWPYVSQRDEFNHQCMVPKTAKEGESWCCAFCGNPFVFIGGIWMNPDDVGERTTNDDLNDHAVERIERHFASGTEPLRHTVGGVMSVTIPEEEYLRLKGLEPGIARPVGVGGHIRYRGWNKMEWPSGHMVTAVLPEGLSCQSDTRVISVRREVLGEWVHADGAPIDEGATFAAMGAEPEKMPHTCKIVVPCRGPEDGDPRVHFRCKEPSCGKMFPPTYGIPNEPQTMEEAGAVRRGTLTFIDEIVRDFGGEGVIKPAVLRRRLEELVSLSPAPEEPTARTRTQRRDNQVCGDLGPGGLTCSLIWPHEPIEHKHITEGKVRVTWLWLHHPTQAAWKLT